MRIRLLLCGGTIDKTYFPEREVFDFQKTHIDEIITRARLNELDIRVSELFLKDSLDLTNEDRQLVAVKCAEADEKHILIMHGTSTMTETANAISLILENDKTVVLFGSMLPFELQKSDAMFNFGAALLACQLVTQGVYISMNGRLWKHDEVRKNEEKAVFYSLQQD